MAVWQKDIIEPEILGNFLQEISAHIQQDNAVLSREQQIKGELPELKWQN
ncbi:MAG: hypothetical protein WC109_03645 [Syntrophomonadaceae bacterium]|mgnify:FL=1|nr:hypothetical protein [Syntrophomonadaceae bacterium]MDD3897502.1 hypothetical protein [Syntrophomonadaceae bacterium]MDD4561809.1 hypothetical protein [Syntrophomonadaceae bacterium]